MFTTSRTSSAVDVTFYRGRVVRVVLVASLALEDDFPLERWGFSRSALFRTLDNFTSPSSIDVTD